VRRWLMESAEEQPWSAMTLVLKQREVYERVTNRVTMENVEQKAESMERTAAESEEPSRTSSMECLGDDLDEEVFGMGYDEADPR
jgi:hypothetical protein